MAQSRQDSRYCFVVDYDDPQAGITRKYQLMYYLSDDTIEMFDIKNRRVFLKRCPYPSLSPNDLFLGATIVVYSRQLRVSEYGDDFTRKVFQRKSEGTLGIVKPDGYEKFGEIINAVYKAGLCIKDLHMVQLAPQEAAEIFANLQNQPEYRDIIQHITSYPVIGLHITGEDCVERWKEVLGDDDPRRAAAGTLRKRFGTSSIKNVCHGSADLEAARNELELFFSSKSPVRRRNNAALDNCTLCLIKPHIVSAGLAGNIITAILEDGFEISAASVAQFDAVDAEDFLEVYKGVIPEYQGLIEHFSSGPCWALEIRCENAVSSFRQFCGPHDPEIAKVLRPDSLRARFGIDKVRNAVHCTDLPEDGVLEVEFMFRILPAKSLNL